MPVVASPAIDTLLHEHAVLLRQYGQTQRRCDQLLASQRARIAALEADTVRLRGTLIANVSALAAEREDRAALEAGVPGLPKRLALVRRVEALVERVQGLMRERLHWQWHGARPIALPVNLPLDVHQQAVLRIDHAADEGAALEASLRAADLVICQTGCISHDAYWRVQDHCKRTGKQCVLVDQPQALHFRSRATVDAAASRDEA